MAKIELNPNTEVEVVMSKKMTVGEYQRMREQALSKGWNINTYEIGFRGKK
jgi:hypothetical protein